MPTRLGVILFFYIYTRLNKKETWQKATQKKLRVQKTSKVHAFSLTTPMQETYQTSPCQTLILLHRQHQLVYRAGTYLTQSQEVTEEPRTYTGWFIPKAPEY